MPELNKTILKNSANLKAYYRFESGALTTDSSGNGHTLTNNNTVAEGTGVFGGSADLELSSSQYFSISSHADFNFGTGEFAFGGWFKKESNAINGGLAVKISSDDGDGWRLTVNGDNTLSFFVDNGAFSISTSGVTDTSNYYHVVVSRVSGVITMYLNSARVASGSSSIDMDSTSSLHLGTYRSNAANYFDGMLDDWFFIKGSGLSADQIKELYEGRYLGELRPNQFGTTAALYHLSSTTDAGGNNYHLTNTNSVGFVAGKFGNCADFGSSNTNKQLSVADPMSINGGAISVSLWVKAQTEIGSGAYGLFIHGNNTSQTAYGINYEYNSGTRRLGFFRTQYAIAKTQGNYTVTLGTTSWYHIVLTYDTTNIRGYLNGNLVVTQAASGNGGGTYLNGLVIGSENGSNYASVFIDELQISSTALTANQIRQIYALGVGKYY